MSFQDITFITGNANKLKEVQIILEYPIQSHSLDLPEIQGTSEEIALHKCKEAASKTQGIVMTEDTCLCFNAWQGLPGPYIKSFIEKVGHDGINRMLQSYDDKTAYALCTFALSLGHPKEPILFQGRTNGSIVPARGKTDFGWDAIFQPENCLQTYGQMSKEDKNSISHRYKALEQLRMYMNEHATLFRREK